MSLNIEAIADRLIEARKTNTTVDKVFPTEDGLSVALAIQVQQEIIRKEVEEGGRIAGFKLGNIAAAMQNKFGVDQPDFGYLMERLFHFERVPVSPDHFISPYVELEPAFVLKHDLQGSQVTVADVISATDYVLPALEIIDSRVKDWKIGIYDTLADCGSVGGVILGAQPRQISELDLTNIAGEILINGKVVAQGNTGDIYGNPVSAIAWVCRRVAEFGIGFKKGDIILAGSCLAAVEMTPNTAITGRFANWGEVSFEYRNGK